jgi:putative flippase GtrA
MTTTISPTTGKPAAEMPALLRPLARLMPQLSYYTVVSALALGLDLAIFKTLVLSGARASVAGIAGYAIGLVLHYALSARYVFETEGSSKSGLRRFVEFCLSGLIGLFITWGVILIATEWLGLPALVGKIGAVGTSFVVVFLLRRGVVFAKPR